MAEEQFHNKSTIMLPIVLPATLPQLDLNTQSRITNFQIQIINNWDTADTSTVTCAHVSAQHMLHNLIVS
jgi:hypothetical protein